MPRNNSIFPSTGYTFGAPHVPDPLAVGGFTVSIPYWDIKADAQATRTVTYGAMWDDDVFGAGGLSHDLLNWLELTWQAAKADWRRFNLLRDSPTGDVLLTDTFGTFSCPRLRAIDLTFLAVPAGVDFWYGTTEFAKFGWVSAFTDKSFNTSQVWINFLKQRVLFPDIYDGLDVSIQGGAISAIMHFWEEAPMPAISFTGFQGFQGYYSDLGYTVDPPPDQ